MNILQNHANILILLEEQELEGSYETLWLYFILTSNSLIAIMLGRLEMDVKTCIEWYTHLCDMVFSDKKTFSIDITTKIRARYDSDLLKDIIKKVIVKHGFNEDALLKNQSQCKVYVICY